MNGGGGFHAPTTYIPPETRSQRIGRRIRRLLPAHPLSAAFRAIRRYGRKLLNLEHQEA